MSVCSRYARVLLQRTMHRISSKIVQVIYVCYREHNFRPNIVLQLPCNLICALYVLRFLTNRLQLIVMLH